MNKNTFYEIDSALNKFIVSDKLDKSEREILRSCKVNLKKYNGWSLE